MVPINTAINPDRITEYGVPKERLESQILFWIAVAGKTASQISPRLDRVLRLCHTGLGMNRWQPFKVVREVGEENLRRMLQEHGIGCHEMKAKGMVQIAHSGLDLRTCSVEDLDAIHGIGLKTASCFVMHTRPEATCAGLDTHILKFLAALGHDVPKATPGSDRLYHKIEKVFLDYVRMSGRTAAQLDLLVWRVYAHHKHLAPWLVRIFKQCKTTNGTSPHHGKRSTPDALTQASRTRRRGSSSSSTSKPIRRRPPASRLSQSRR